MDYMNDEEYANLTGNGPENSFTFDPSQGTSDYSLEPYWDVNDPTYYDLADQLSQAGLIPQDQFGAPDLSALLGGQYSDALSSGNLGDLSQYSGPAGNDALQQMAMQQANLVGSGFEEVPGNPYVVIDSATGQPVDKVNLADYLSNPNQSRVNSRLNDILAQDAPQMSTVNDMGDVVARQGPYSAVYDPEDPSSFNRAANLIDYQAQPGTGLYDDRSMMQKLGSGALSLLQGAGGGRALPGNTNNAAGSGLRSGMSLAQMLALAAGALQGRNKGAAPGDNRPNPGAQNWQISRAAGSGRRNKAVGGLLQMARGGRPSGGQDDVVPINAAHGEYIFDADTVSALGDGNTEAGAAKLDEMRQNIRQHKRSAPVDKIPPKAKSPLAYMKGDK